MLYIHRGCPWAHRANIVRSLKGLEDVVRLVTFNHSEKSEGKVLWCFEGEEREPLYGFKYLKDVYKKGEPGFDGRFTVPMLWDTKTGKYRLTSEKVVVDFVYLLIHLYGFAFLPP